MVTALSQTQNEVMHRPKYNKNTIHFHIPISVIVVILLDTKKSIEPSPPHPSLLDISSTLPPNIHKQQTLLVYFPLPLPL